MNVHSVIKTGPKYIFFGRTVAVQYNLQGLDNFENAGGPNLAAASDRYLMQSVTAIIFPVTLK
jgi:hypothetical protein